MSKCRERVGKPPPCTGDRKAKMGWIICKSWDKVARERMDLSSGMKAAWAEMRAECEKR